MVGLVLLVELLGMVKSNLPFAIYSLCERMRKRKWQRRKRSFFGLATKRWGLSKKKERSFEKINDSYLDVCICSF
jgi:hypothetical protein